MQNALLARRSKKITDGRNATDWRRLVPPRLRTLLGKARRLRRRWTLLGFNLIWLWFEIVGCDRRLTMQPRWLCYAALYQTRPRRMFQTLNWLRPKQRLMRPRAPTGRTSRCLRARYRSLWRFQTIRHCRISFCCFDCGNAVYATGAYRDSNRILRGRCQKRQDG